VDVGLIVGDEDGLMVGDVVGLMVGDVVGLIVGDVVGLTVGLNVVGLVVGEAVTDATVIAGIEPVAFNAKLIACIVDWEFAILLICAADETVPTMVTVMTTLSGPPPTVR